MIIRVDTDVLRSNGSQLRTLVDKLRVVQASVKEISTKLNAAWDGGASEDVLLSMNEQYEAMGLLAEKMAEAAADVQNVADSFEAVDNSGGKETTAVTQLITALKPLRPMKILTEKWTGSLRIVPDEVISCGESYCRAGEELEKNTDAYKDILLALQESWEGNSYRNFAETSDEITKNLNLLCEEMVDLGKTTVQIAEVYRDIDAKIRF